MRLPVARSRPTSVLPIETVRQSDDKIFNERKPCAMSGIGGLNQESAIESAHSIGIAAGSQTGGMTRFCKNAGFALSANASTFQGSDSLISMIQSCTRPPQFLLATFLAIAFGSMATGPAKAEPTGPIAKESLYGVWESKVVQPDVTVVTYHKFRVDGTRLTVSLVTAAGGKKWYFVQGSWELAKNLLTSTATKSDHPAFPVGRKQVYEITHLTKRELTLSPPDAFTRTFTRVQELPTDFRAKVREALALGKP